VLSLAALRKAAAPDEEAEMAEEPLSPDHLLAAAALFSGTSGVFGFNACGAIDGDALPPSLKAFRDLRFADLSGCSALKGIDGVRACGELRALDLSNLPCLVDLKCLQILPFLESLDLSGCVGLASIRPMLVGRVEALMERDSSRSSLQDMGDENSRLLPRGPRALGHPSLSSRGASG